MQSIISSTSFDFIWSESKMMNVKSMSNNELFVYLQCLYTVKLMADFNDGCAEWYNTLKDLFEKAEVLEIVSRAMETECFGNEMDFILNRHLHILVA